MLQRLHGARAMHKGSVWVLLTAPIEGQESPSSISSKGSDHLLFLLQVHDNDSKGHENEILHPAERNMTI